MNHLLAHNPLFLTSFFLGLLGSIHCITMCGPLIIATHRNRCHSVSSSHHLLLYHSGRTLAYIIIGIIAGLLGTTASWVGLQSWISIALGIVMILPVFVQYALPLNSRALTVLVEVRSWIATRLRSSLLPRSFVMGIINGLLPCGLVYVAAASAITTQNALQGSICMLGFGLGTLPSTLAITLGIKRLPQAWLRRGIGLIPFAVAAVGVMLIARGLSFASQNLNQDPLNSNIP